MPFLCQLQADMSEDRALTVVYDALHLSGRNIKFFCKLFKSNAVDQSTAKNVSISLGVDILGYDFTNLAVRVFRHR